MDHREATVRATITPGASLGRYHVDRRLGAGGMGEVWEGHHAILDRRVAIKSLHPHLAGDDVVLQRFLREGQAAARIAHPNVVPIHDVGIEDGVPILVMDFLDGPDLAALFAERGRLPAEELLELMLPVVAAVAAAHDGGVVHRDLKPENVVITRDRAGRPHPVVVDFGISRQLDQQESMRLTASGAIIGTPAYMAPEQARGDRDVGFAADQYALGAILFHGLTGQRPVEGESLLQLLTRIVRGEHPRPIELVPTLDRRIDDIVMRAMAPEPRDRFPSVRALGAALLPFAELATRHHLAPELARAADTVQGLAPRLDPPRRRPWAAWLAVAMLGAGAATAVALALGSSPTPEPTPTPDVAAVASPDAMVAEADAEPGDAAVAAVAADTGPDDIAPAAIAAGDDADERDASAVVEAAPDTRSADVTRVPHERPAARSRVVPPPRVEPARSKAPPPTATEAPPTGGRRDVETGTNEAPIIPP